jgi:hypothetical protein
MSDFAPLRFDFSDFAAEIAAIVKLTSRFLDPSTASIFSQLQNEIQQVQRSKTEMSFNWDVSESRPLRTLPTSGYECGKRKGAIDVVGEISWRWQIQKCFAPKSLGKYFIVSGNASVKVSIFDANGSASDRLAMWRVECGAADSPGCFFHTQILGDDGDGPFPKRLSIPRLPTLFVTPMAVIEFFLGELFQDDWQKHITGTGGAKDYWSGVQKRRLESLLKWKLRQIRNCQGSPWLALKLAKPTSDDNPFTQYE